MHRKLKALEKLHAECKRTDEMSQRLGMYVTSRDEWTRLFHWGVSETIRPRKNVSAPMCLELTRDVFLMPNANIALEYNLGFEDDWRMDKDQLFLAYRLDLVHQFHLGEHVSGFNYPLTIFQEMVSGKWRATARMRYGEDKDTIFVRPAEWSALLEEHGLDEFGELADGLSAKRAHDCIKQMLTIASQYVPSKHQIIRRKKKVLDD